MATLSLTGKRQILSFLLTPAICLISSAFWFLVFQTIPLSTRDILAMSYRLISSFRVLALGSLTKVNGRQINPKPRAIALSESGHKLRMASSGFAVPNRGGLQPPP